MEAPSEAPPDVKFRFGVRVQLHGLVNAAELNGAVGRLRDFYPQKGRWAVAVRGCAAPKLLKPENLEALPADPLDFANIFVDVLADDVVLRMCSYLPGRALLDVGCACSVLHNHAQHNVPLWRSLCRALLGDALSTLHEQAWGNAGEGAAALGVRTPAFWRALFRAGYSGERFRFATEFRRRFPMTGASEESSGVPRSPAGESAVPVAIQNYDDFHRAISASGHTVAAVGHHMVAIGGWRPHAEDDNDLHICVLDLKRACIFRPRLAPDATCVGGEDSARPCRRLRHASCVVRRPGAAQEVLPGLEESEEASEASKVLSQAVLVLGGCHDESQQPCDGLQTLLLLEFTRPDFGEARWRQLPAAGDAPKAIWHHTAGSFSQGKRVVVFGGDFTKDDPEFVHIGDRSNAHHVYVLDVDQCIWQRVATTGDVPSWRSLHASAVYTSLADGSERLVIMGGGASHTRIFGRPSTQASMEGYSLNLETFRWQSGASVARRRRGTPFVNRFLPPSRMRFAAERYGRYLLVYGGHGGMAPLGEEDLFLTLNLMTLEWKRARIVNDPASYPDAPAAVLCGGCLVGGVLMTNRRVIPIPKLDFVCLCRPEVELD